jgi:DeoR/GlpR family transcriptional regulator of sugar metabolism
MALNEKIYEMIRHQPGIQRKDLVEQTGASVRTVARVISELLSGGKIERRGTHGMSAQNGRPIRGCSCAAPSQPLDAIKEGLSLG